LDKEELKNGTFGFRIFGKTYVGCILVVDFGVLKPSVSRHEDFIIHVYTRDSSYDIDSKAIHSIGETTEKHSLLFQGLENFFKSHTNFELCVIYSDGAFRTALNLDFLVELQRSYCLVIIWNYFASNHGGGAADADLNQAQSYLKKYVQNNNLSLKGIIPNNSCLK